MGDLAFAIVELAAAAEKRRQARKSLRESIEVVASAVLKDARVSDEADIGDSPPAPSYVYVVERVKWDVRLDMNGEHDDGFVHTELSSRSAATLVQYRLSEPRDLSKTVAENEHAEGAVLLDAREPYDYFREINGDVVLMGKATPHPSKRFWRDPRPGEAAEGFHLATDQELVLFAEHAVDVAGILADNISDEAKRFSAAAQSVAKLTPR